VALTSPIAQMDPPLEFDVLPELGLDEAEMLLHAGQAAMHRAHDAKEAVERLGVLAQRGRVLI
jgi:hypothetical protein